MIKKVCVVVCLALCLIASPAVAADIAGIVMPETLTAGNAPLLLNGAGVRTKFFMDLYVGGLFLQEKSSDAEVIINADEPMAIRLHIISSMITSERMEEATREGFENATDGNTAPIQTEIENFISVFKEKINVNDVYDLVYAPGSGVEAYKNETLIATIPGLEFKKALFGIWLCDKPAQKSLKKEMLGM
ncbi:MAG: chalcone isomerase family protein [Deltaproteobacteria bacterium]|nr:chalcone isomerase family protein [Deltaproteobacteria bacterium]